MKQVKIILFIAVLSTTFFSAGVAWERFQDNNLETQIIAKPVGDQEDWGEFYLLTPETTATYGMDNMMSGIAEIQPGKSIHPPHVHEEEELLLVFEGQGTWSINGEESVANTGDMMYSEPWDEHGIVNTGDQTLKFFFVKWNTKGVEKVKKPER